MKLPWDKLEFKKVDPDTKKGTKPSNLLMDEIGQMNSPFPHDIGWKNIPIITNPQLEYEVKSYPDGSKYVNVNKIEKTFTFRVNNYEDLWILNQIHDVIKNDYWENIQVTIPNLLDAQADRRFNPNQPHGLKLVCNFLNGLSKFSYKIFHPHNAEVVEALLDRVEIIDNFEFIDRILNYKITRFKEDMEGQVSNLILMSSDAGGFKPLMKLTDKLKWQGETFSASKSRAYVDGETKLVQMIDRQDFEGKDILIIDDICVYGGTFKGLSKMLKERNCGKLYLAVSHLTVQDLGEDPVTNYFEKVFTTNSKFDRYTMRGIDKEVIYPENLEIINLF